MILLETICELGWLGLPEKDGGFGGDFMDHILMESFEKV